MDYILEDLETFEGSGARVEYNFKYVILYKHLPTQDRVAEDIIGTLMYSKEGHFISHGLERIKAVI